MPRATNIADPIAAAVRRAIADNAQAMRLVIGERSYRAFLLELQAWLTKEMALVDRNWQVADRIPLEVIEP
jgi:hypothetical protein